MSNPMFPAAAKSLIETSRKSLVGAIDATRGNAQHALHACDQAFQSGTDALLRAPVQFTSALRDDLVSIEAQLTLLAGMFTQVAAERSTAVTDRAAVIASAAADNFEQVFDLRVMRALENLGLPARPVVADVADRLAALAAAIDRLIQTLQPAPVIAAPKVGKAAKSKATAPRRGAKRAKHVAH